MTYRLSAVYSVTQQQMLEQQIQSRIQSWCDQWFGVSIQLAEVQFNQQLFGSLVAPQNSKHWFSGELSCYGRANFAEVLLKKLTAYTDELHTDDMDLVVKPFVSNILADLSSRLGGIERTSSEQVGMELKIEIHGCDLLLQIGASLLQRLASATFPVSVKPPITLTDALAMETVDISIELKSQSLQMQQISSLKRGSIIQLTQRLEQPLPLYASGAVVLNGHLVAQNQQKAFYITSSTKERN